MLFCFFYPFQGIRELSEKVYILERTIAVTKIKQKAIDEKLEYIKSKNEHEIDMKVDAKYKLEEMWAEHEVDNKRSTQLLQETERLIIACAIGCIIFSIIAAFGYYRWYKIQIVLDIKLLRDMASTD